MQKYFVSVKNVLVDLFTVKHICKYNVGDKKYPYCLKVKSDDTIFTIEYETGKERDEAFEDLQEKLISIVNSSLNN